MPLTVTLTIGGVDYAPWTRIGTIVVHESLRDRANTLAGLEVVMPYSGSTPEAGAIPRAGQEVILTVAGTREFGGVVQRVSERPGGSTSLVYEIDCADYTRWLDRHLVQGVKYPVSDDPEVTGTAGSVVTAIVTNWANKGAITWDTSGVVAGPTINQQTFDFIPPSQAIDQIAKLVGFRWYVTYDRVVTFAPPTDGTNAAPVASYTWETDTGLSDLVLSEVGDQIVNVAYIKDAKAVQSDSGGAPLSFSQRLGTADGYQSFWGLGYEPAGVSTTTVTVTPTSGPATTYTQANGGLLTENVDGVPGDGQTRAKALLCLPNWGVRFETVPPAGATVEATYQYLDVGPAVWQVLDGASITEVRNREGSTNSDGVYEEVFSAGDLEAASKDSIRARAEMYLRQRAHKWSGSAIAIGTGWRAGQWLTVTSSQRFAGAFASGRAMYVTDVRKGLATPDAWRNEITLSTDVYGEL